MTKYIRLDQIAAHFPIVSEATPAAPNPGVRLPISEKPAITPRPTGFVVRITSRRMTGFIAWAETSVFELSPLLRDAWKFPSQAAAHQAVTRAIGPAAAKLNIAVMPWSQA